ncbi:MAG: hypothetical protein FRC54_08100 [bacterium LCO1.1]|uniref:Uncharacterized protein n=1 Tax=Candidatus Weimeria bifida TaxID=2599074 RepID=A0A6N7IZY1_9FIRM|nr:hypothetical protein [Candidatus Weimeria bifida]
MKNVKRLLAIAMATATVVTAAPGAVLLLQQILQQTLMPAATTLGDEQRLRYIHVDDEEVTADTDAKKKPALKLNTVTDAGKTAAITVSGTTEKVYVIPEDTSVVKADVKDQTLQSQHRRQARQASKLQ